MVNRLDTLDFIVFVIYFVALQFLLLFGEKHSH